jgi:hypothetical protein
MIIGACTMWAFNAHSFETWDGCKDCHGSFRSSPYVSLTDGQSWGTSLHDGHSSLMLSRDCDACHGWSLTPVILNSSLKGAASDPISCVGCHGRAEDRIDPAIPIGDGAGLRQRHWNAGTTSCFDCHEDSDPAIYTPVGEHVLPPYYLTPDPDHLDKPTDPCNLAGEEDYLGTLLALDNDGDLDYDESDSDCSAQTVEVDCFDGIDNDSDGLSDCLDSDCEGVMGGPCDTGQDGICAAGTGACLDGEEICLQDELARPEEVGAGNCGDGLDNDCDRWVDTDDSGCVQAEGEVFVTRFRAPKSLRIRGNRTVSKRIVAVADGVSKAQQATVALTANHVDALSVGIDPASVTTLVGTADGAVRLTFMADIACNQSGEFALEWTVGISAPENADASNDTQIAATSVTCR